MEFHGIPRSQRASRRSKTRRRLQGAPNTVRRPNSPQKALEASLTCNLLGFCNSKNDPKTIQKWISILPKIHQNLVLEAPKSMSGGLWDKFGSVLGQRGLSWTFLEGAWTVLEASWKRLGGLLGRFGRKKVAANMAPSWLAKRNPNL